MAVSLSLQSMFFEVSNHLLSSQQKQNMLVGPRKSYNGPALPAVNTSCNDYEAIIFPFLEQGSDLCDAMGVSA